MCKAERETKTSVLCPPMFFLALLKAAARDVCQCGSRLASVQSTKINLSSLFIMPVVSFPRQVSGMTAQLDNGLLRKILHLKEISI